MISIGIDVVVVVIVVIIVVVRVDDICGERRGQDREAHKVEHVEVITSTRSASEAAILHFCHNKYF